MSVEIVKREPHEKGKGLELNQWLCGCAGASVTTLPAFLVLPIWAVFVASYRVTDSNGKDDDFACGLICFSAGLLIWGLAALFINI